MGQCGPVVALVFQSLWCMADDGGVAMCDPIRVKGEMFVLWPAIGTEEIENALRVLTKEGRILIYRFHDETYAQIVHWDHQKIHKPSPFRHPRPTDPGAVPVELGTDEAPSVNESGTPRVLDIHMSRHLDDQTPDIRAVQETAQESELIDREFATLWTIYPKREGGNSRHDALKAYRARRRTGVECQVMLDGTERYANYCRGKGWIRTAFVKQAAAFYGPGEHYLESWEVGETPLPPSRMNPADRISETIAKMAGGGIVS